jgi:hypothetical protein
MGHFKNARLVIPGLIKAALGRSGATFDFAMLAFGNVGTTAVNILINDHPEIALPYRDDSVEVLSGRKNPPRSKVNGLMFHFPGQVKAARRLIRVRVKRDVLIQFVREPASNALSMYNRQVFKGCIRRESGPSFEEFLADKKFVPHLLPFESAQPIAGSFARWEVFDLPALLPDAIDRTLARIFSLVGVSDDVRIEDSRRRFTNNFELYMYYGRLKHGMDVDLPGARLSVQVALERGLSLRTRFDAELFRVPVPSPHLDTDRRVIVLARSGDVARLSPGLREQLTHDVSLQAEVAERCIRELETRYEEFLPVYEGAKSDGLSRSERQCLANRVGDDTENMRRKFENLHEAWPESLV